MDGSMSPRRVRVVDSHTEGEPTRVVVSGGPDLGAGDAAARLRRMRRDHDGFRSAVVNEPRGFDAMVGALLAEPNDPDAAAQVIFFNNVGYLGMCVHGTIGVVRTLSWMGLLGAGSHRLETPVGDVGITLHEDGLVEVENVRSYRTAASVTVQTSDYGPVTGDVAWGGNWFFLVGEHGQRLDLPQVRQMRVWPIPGLSKIPIGFSGTKTDNVPAGTTKFSRQGRDGHGRRGFYSLDAF